MATSRRLPGWRRTSADSFKRPRFTLRTQGGRDQSTDASPYFVLDGNVCALLAAKDHINLFLYDGAIVPDPEGIIRGRDGDEGREDDRAPAREGRRPPCPRR